jgi:hypothetical protein
MEKTGELPTYPSEESALRRVATLKTAGYWPGTVELPDGRWRLTYDPEITRKHWTAPAHEGTER